MTALTVFAIRWWAIITMVYGFLVCLGGPVRWSARSYRALNQMPGSPYTWGLVAIVAGLLILVGSVATVRRLRNVGLWIMAAWCTTLGAGFVTAAITDDHVSLGIPVLFAAAAGHALSLTQTDEQRTRVL